jgi:hypothetical protein
MTDKLIAGIVGQGRGNGAHPESSWDPYYRDHIGVFVRDITHRCRTLGIMGKASFWTRAIRRFEESDRAQPPNPGVIVFTGSSSINFWEGWQKTWHR